MRRRDREVSDPAKIREIIAACHCCRLGFADGGKIYIVPLNFGYQEEDGQRTFFFHSAPEGRKIDLIEKTHCAGFELDTHYQLNSARFQSVIGSGRVELVREEAAKVAALRCIMRHNTGREDWSFSPQAVQNVAVFRLDVEEISAKEHA